LNIKKIIFYVTVLLNIFVAGLMYINFIGDHAIVLTRSLEQLQIKERLLQAKIKNYEQKDENSQKLQELGNTHKKLIENSEIPKSIVSLTELIKQSMLKENEIRVLRSELLSYLHNNDDLDVYRTRVNIEAAGDDQSILNYLSMLESEHNSYNVETIRINRGTVNVQISIYSYTLN